MENVHPYIIDSQVHTIYQGNILFHCLIRFIWTPIYFHQWNRPLRIPEESQNHCSSVSCWTHCNFTGKKVSVNSIIAGIHKVRLYIAIVLSCPFTGCWTNERANQRAAQNNYYIKPGFWVPGFVLLELCYFLPRISFIVQNLTLIYRNDFSFLGQTVFTMEDKFFHSLHNSI